MITTNFARLAGCAIIGLVLSGCGGDNSNNNTDMPTTPPVSSITLEKYTPENIDPLEQCTNHLSETALLHARDRMKDGPREVIEPEYLFVGEPFTLQIKQDENNPTYTLTELQYYPVGSHDGEDVTILYDDGTHGDSIAGDGIFTRSCLYFNEEVLRGEDMALGPINTKILSTSWKGAEEIYETNTGVRVTEGGFFISVGEEYAERIENPWSLHRPDDCQPCVDLWTIAGDVFDFIGVATRDDVGGEGYARVHDNIMGTGFNPGCDERSHCYEIADGKKHQEFLGVLWLPNTQLDGVIHELGHGLIGIETEDFPGPGLEQWNEGDGAHLDSDSTINGDLSGPFWDPARGWPHSVRMLDENGEPKEVYIVENEVDGGFKMKLEDDDRFVWSDLLLYMMGLKKADEVTERYYKLVNPIMYDCETYDRYLLCPDDYITAERIIEFGIDEFVEKYGEWEVYHPFDPTNISMGVANISNRPHTEAEMVWITQAWRHISSAQEVHSTWSNSRSWPSSTKGLSKLDVNALKATSEYLGITLD